MTTEATAPRKRSKLAPTLLAVAISLGLVVAFALLLGQLAIMGLQAYGQVQEHTSSQVSEDTEEAFATYAQERYGVELTEEQLESLSIPETFSQDIAPGSTTVYGSILLPGTEESEFLTLVYQEGVYRLVTSGALSELPLQ